MTTPTRGGLGSLETRPGVAPAEWDEMVRRLGGSIYHSTVWAEYHRTAAVEPLFMLARDAGGEPLAAALALLRSSTRPLASLLFRDLRLSAHPVLREGDTALAARMMDAIENVARARGCHRLGLGSFMSGASPFLPAEHGYTETERVEFCLDLSQSTDAIWQGIRKDQREKIRRLRREGVVIEPGTTIDDLLALRSTREATHARRVQQGQSYDLAEDPALYERLYHHLVKQGAARLFIARRGGEVLATLFFSTWNGRAYSVFSGSSEAGYRLGTQSGLFWAAVETLKAEGFHELNRGGVPATAAAEADPLHGIYLFKLRLGTTPRLCRSGTKVLSPMRHRLAVLGRKLWRP